MSMASNLAQRVERAISKLKSLRDDADLGVVEVVACGKAAIPALRELLFQGDPSDASQPRCRAIEALASLNAHGVLIDYLNILVLIQCMDAGRRADPAERLGDDAVINAAAVVVAEVRDEQVFHLLQELGKRPSLTGVISALGSFGRIEAIPLLINALEHDASRPAAEEALKKVGRSARSPLIASATLPLPSKEHESVSSLRRRRSALRLLKEIGILPQMWPELRCLMSDEDARISTLVCEIGVLNAHPDEKYDVLQRLIDVSAEDDWMVHDDVEECLVHYFESMRSEGGQRGRSPPSRE
jgi:PBS lyase HEAT-like repeat